MNAIQILLADHKKMKKMVNKLAKTTERAVETRKEMFKIIQREAKLHEKMEETYLYPYLKEIKKSRSNAFEHHEEVALMEHMLKQLSKTPCHKEEWTAKFWVLKELNDHHIDEEEDDKFPQAIKLLSKDLLKEIGDQMLAFKKRHQS